MLLHSRIIRLFSVTLALNILMVTIGVALDFHICHGEIKSIGVFEKANVCSNMGTNSSCDSTKESNENGLSQESCCRNEQVLCSVNIESSVRVYAENVSQDIVGFDLIIFPFRKTITIDKYTKAIPLLRPPPIEKDISILFQTFLI